MSEKRTVGQRARLQQSRHVRAAPRDLVSPASQRQYAKQGPDTLNSGQSCHFISFSPITTVHLIKKMSEVRKLKMGKRIIFFQEASPQDVAVGIRG